MEKAPQGAFSLVKYSMFFYTYIHYRLDNNKPFYIGKGKGYRAYAKKRPYNSHWTNIVNKAGFKAVILAHWQTEEEAFEHEKVLIESFRSMGYELTNKCNGGEGPSGAIRSQELKDYLRSLHIGKKRRPLTEEEKNHLRSFHKGKKKGPLSPEHRQKVIDGIKRRKELFA